MLLCGLRRRVVARLPWVQAGTPSVLWRYWRPQWLSACSSGKALNCCRRQHHRALSQHPSSKASGPHPGAAIQGCSGERGSFNRVQPKRWKSSRQRSERWPNSWRSPNGRTTWGNGTSLPTNIRSSSPTPGKRRTRASALRRWPFRPRLETRHSVCSSIGGVGAGGRKLIDMARRRFYRGLAETPIC